MSGESERSDERAASEEIRADRRRSPSPPSSERRDLLADRYELLELLGRGGSASVWHAYDKRLAREVALKIFHLGAHDREGLARALREAKAASHIASDHVVRIRDVAWGGAKGAYIDMELCADFVDGELVVGRSIAQTPPRDLSEAVRWVMQAARGVQSAHDLRVFHRDLKPDNILIRPASRTALVTDFGLARQPLWREEDADTPLPGADLGATWHEVQHYVGTPPYMAPEQADGLFRHLARLPRDPAARRPDPADEDRLARIDVYGLGAVLYECLAGRPPYQPREATSDRTQEALDILAQVRAAPPPPLRGLTLSHASFFEGRRFRVPRRLHRIVQKAMARDPSARYASAAALARDLSSVLERQPTSLERHRYDAQALLWGRRNLRPLLASSLAVLGFVSLSLARPEDAPLRRKPLAAAFGSHSELQSDAKIDGAVTPVRSPADSVASSKDNPSVASETARGHRSGNSGHDPRTRRGLKGRTANKTRTAPTATSARISGPATPVPTRESEMMPILATSPTESLIAASAAHGPGPHLAATEPKAPATSASIVTRDADRSSANLDSDSREGVAAFIDMARRAGAPLIQVVDATGSVTEYCINPPGLRDVRTCVKQGECSEDERSKLEKLHRQSTRAFIWHLDAQHRVIRKCEKTRPYDNNIIRKTCDPVIAS